MKSVTLFILLPFASALWRVKPRITRPSPPRNVTVVPVSTSELGVSWTEPLYDGGSPVISYLVEWDDDKFFSSGVASPSSPYENNKHSEVVQANGTNASFLITGLDAVPYWVRVSAIADGQSPAISSEPPFQVPSGTLPGFLTNVAVSLASDSETADRLKISWSAPKFDVNGFSALPVGCGGESPHSTPASIESFRVRWSDSPAMKASKQYDIPAIVGDGMPLLCCPSDSSVGTCSFELGAEVQTLSVTNEDSTVAVGNSLFDSGAVRLMYLGGQSKSIRVKPPQHDGVTTIQIDPSADLPVASPIAVGDVIKIADNSYVISNVDAWPHAVELEGGFASSSSPLDRCRQVSADNLRDYLLEGFDDSPFGESLAVSREIVTRFVGELGETRVVGFLYHVTFLGQGFSSALGGGVDEFLILSSGPGDCSPFLSDGFDVSSHVNVTFSTNVDAGSVVPGQRYYVEMAAVNAHGVGPYVHAKPRSQIAATLPGLPQNCAVYATPSSSSSLVVEWRGVWPDHGATPSLYRVEAYDADSGSPTPVVTYNVSEIDETSQYSAKIDGLVPGGRYRLVIVPANAYGERSPSWFSSFDPSSVFNKEDFPHSQNFLERACNAVPKCSSESSGCIETDMEEFVITARSPPPPPLVQCGTFPEVSSRNRFAKDSVLVTFESSGLNSGSPTDKFLVEWSTLPSFLSEKDGEVTKWSSEVVASYSDDTGLNAVAELLLDSLTMGTQYFVRVSAHNTAGFGAPTQGTPVKPMTKPDPPFEPVLSNFGAPPYFSIASRVR
ncbi:hypothetical protein THAOC_36165 [Thalassiosira oceanica]|uniref:Fibronectin type-III domain-containing protein n=1 Tax=Thalassiosira oceanica TaxID=159749 RepID=K0R0P8_THAOC|nr:hypothetical protein THAOC_36165 [Thalassiosira oceanica]|eukprot:EJK45230.1 hypothetical protein THAOC_36165 [Thalassiosira oceanica]